MRGCSLSFPENIKFLVFPVKGLPMSVFGFFFLERFKKAYNVCVVECKISIVPQYRQLTRIWACKLVVARLRALL